MGAGKLQYGVVVGAGGDKALDRGVEFEQQATLDCANQTSRNDEYQFAAGSPTATTFVVQAAPQGAQSTRDTQCGTVPWIRPVPAWTLARRRR